MSGGQPHLGPVEKLELVRALVGVPGLRLEATRIAVALATLLGKSGEAYPSRATLSAITGIDTRHATRAIKALVRRGLVVVVKPGGPRESARYCFAVGAVLAASSASRGTSEAPGEAALARLYGHLWRASQGTAAVPPEAPEGQVRTTEAQAKGVLKLSAPRSAPASSPTARPRRDAQSRPNGNEVVSVRHPWLATMTGDKGQ